jgi:hypothetical protein
VIVELPTILELVPLFIVEVYPVARIPAPPAPTVTVIAVPKVIGYP